MRSDGTLPKDLSYAGGVIVWGAKLGMCIDARWYMGDRQVVDV